VCPGGRPRRGKAEEEASSTTTAFFVFFFRGSWRRRSTAADGLLPRLFTLFSFGFGCNEEAVGVPIARVNSRDGARIEIESTRAK
jgi:hypothetical protein